MRFSYSSFCCFSSVSFSPCGVSYATRFPVFIIPTLSHSMSTSCMSCEHRIIVCPSSFRSCIMFQSTLFVVGSNPIVGSSKNSMSGLCTRLATSDAFCFCPPDRCLISLFSAYFMSTNSINSSILSNFSSSFSP